MFLIVRIKSGAKIATFTVILRKTVSKDFPKVGNIGCQKGSSEFLGPKVSGQPFTVGDCRFGSQGFSYCYANTTEGLPYLDIPIPILPVIESSMANFEVDPLPWLPWGHHFINGGPTRLPRSFYYPIEDPLPQHQAYCYAVVHPAPPPHQEGFWRDQVRDLLIGPLHRDLVEVQPSLFGVGLYQFSRPNAVNALVQHGPYPLPPLHHNRLVRFVHVNDAINHRATQGFRTDWLMILGIPPDYHNDVHIANAISSFGKFHF
jgi:hypothetical protein